MQHSVITSTHRFVFVILNLFIGTFLFGQNGEYPFDLIEGEYIGQRLYKTNESTNPSYEYKLKIDYLGHYLEVKENNSWRKLVRHAHDQRQSSNHPLTDGVLYEFTINDSPFYEKMTLATIGKSKADRFEKGILVTLYEKNSTNTLVYIFDKIGGNPDPIQFRKDQLIAEKEERRSERRNRYVRYGVNVGGGYTISDNDFSSLNTVIAQYNTPSDVTQSIGELNQLKGFFAQGDLYLGYVYIGANWAWRQNETFGIRPNSLGTAKSTYFRVEHQTMGGQLGAIFHAGKWLKIVLGGSFQFAKFKYLSQEFDNEKDREGEKVSNLIDPQDNRPKQAGGFAKLLLGNFGNVDGTHIILFAEGQYNVGLSSYNLLKVNQAFNPNTYLGMDNRNLNLNNDYKAIKIGLLLGMGF